MSIMTSIGTYCHKYRLGCQIKTNAPQNGAFLPLLTNLAGDESLNWHPLAADFILIGRRLEQLGFVYHNGMVIITDPDEM